MLLLPANAGCEGGWGEEPAGLIKNVKIVEYIKTRDLVQPLTNEQ
jgi:hypothetical protein